MTIDDFLVDLRKVNIENGKWVIKTFTYKLAQHMCEAEYFRYCVGDVEFCPITAVWATKTGVWRSVLAALITGQEMEMSVKDTWQIINASDGKGDEILQEKIRTIISENCLT